MWPIWIKTKTNIVFCLSWKSCEFLYHQSWTNSLLLFISILPTPVPLLGLQHVATVPGWVPKCLFSDMLAPPPFGNGVDAQAMTISCRLTCDLFGIFNQNNLSFSGCSLAQVPFIRESDHQWQLQDSSFGSRPWSRGQLRSWQLWTQETVGIFGWSVCKGVRYDNIAVLKDWKTVLLLLLVQN